MGKDPAGAQEPSRMAGLVSGARRALIAFVLVDVVLLVGGVVLYLVVFRPQIARVEAVRDHAMRTNMALDVRLRAVEARYAVARGDMTGAQEALAHMRTRLSALSLAVPKAEERERSAVHELIERAALVEAELARDPETARRDLEVVDARLAALYPVDTAPSSGATAAP